MQKTFSMRKITHTGDKTSLDQCGYYTDTIEILT